MSEAPPSERRAGRWVLIALVVIAVLIVTGVVGVPWAIRSQLITNQAKCCDIAMAFDRARPGGTEDGPAEVGQCLNAVVDDLGASVRDQLEQAQVEHSGELRRPAEPLGAPLLDVPLTAETFAAVDRCATARTSRWRSGYGLAVQGLLERYTREAHLARDPDERLRRLTTAVELWVDVYAVYDLSITGPLLWAREIGATGGAASASVRAASAERLRALAASLPDIETSTAIFYCAVYGEVRELDITDAWEANDQFGASLAMAAATTPATWGREPAESRLDRAIPSGVQHDQFVEPGSAYIAGSLLVSAHQLESSEERFLGQPIGPMDLDDEPMSTLPCSELVLPSALDDRELQLCAIDPAAVVATQELHRLYRAVRATALAKPSDVPERVDDLELRPSADDPSVIERVAAEPGCVPTPRPVEAREAWGAVGYEPAPERRVTLTLLHPPPGPEPDPLVTSPGGIVRYPRGPVAGWRLLRARWRIGRVPDLMEPSRVVCEGPVQEARLWMSQPPEFAAGELELGPASEPSAQRP